MKLRKIKGEMISLNLSFAEALAAKAPMKLKVNPA